MNGVTGKLELLCPARDLECGVAAINHGADAVYIGAPKFGARAAAGNSLADISKLVDHAHRHWARVYVTLNTLIYDSELEEARNLVRQVYDAGADALIVQDMGLLELDLPPIPLFASTQTHNYDLERIKFLEQVGIQRIILARELSLQQLRSIRAATSLELEFFVHGALCVSFSGQCYMSQAVSGRSANRGECAQNCRLPYTLVDSRGTVLANNRHLLSLKDLNLSPYLDQLVDAGVTSFKIEGRLKDATYVRNLTAFYRGKLDAVIAGREGFSRASSGTTVFSFAPDPERTFHRGTTDYFLRGRRHGIAEFRTPKSMGKTVGTVKSVGGDSFILEGQEPLHGGDGICFFDANEDLQGTNVNAANGARITPNSMEGIQPGTVIYRNFDHEFARVLSNDAARRAIGVSMAFGETPDGFFLRAVDEDGVEAASSIVHPKEPAKKPDAATAAIRTQLGRLGETIFALTALSVETREAWFLPVSLLNGLRRECLASLEAERLRRFPRWRHSISLNDVPYPSPTLDRSGNVVNELAGKFYRRHGVECVEQGFELRHDPFNQIVMTTRHCLKFEFGLCRGDRGSADELFMFDGKTRYRLEFDCDRCEMKVVTAAPVA
jgi:23S rRNA 5-hydroxycytidine C2501 synthase